jgi:hypothetical protein
MPGETKEDLEEGRKNLREIAGNWFNIACASPLVGSEMHELALKKGYIQVENIGADYHFATINTPDFTKEFIQDFQYMLNLELNFVFNQDIKHKRYDLALLGFKNVIKLRFDHAFAHYYSYLCYKSLKDELNAEDSLNSYNKYAQTDFWKKYIKLYDLPQNLITETIN